MKSIDHVIATYFRAWNTTSIEESRRCIEEACSPDLVYRDPKYTARGITEMVERTRISHTKNPGFDVFVTTVIDGYDDLFRYDWAFVIEARQLHLPGFDLVERDREGRIAKLTSFFGERILLPRGEPLRVGAPWQPSAV